MAVNPVLTGERRNQYTSSGSLGPYNFTFVIYADADLSVYVDDTLKTLSTHYTVSTNANGTGSITFTAGNAPASGALVTIIGNKDISRSTRFTSGGPLTADALETEFNSGLALLQQLDEKISRAITLPIETDATRPLEFPYDNTEANNADRVVKFNAAGSALEIGPTAAGLETLAAIAADISTVAGISADVTSVAADAADIGVVSTNIASVNTVANNINDVITVANDLNEAISEVETVADDLNEAVSEIDTVSNNITDVQTVGNATNIANIGTVAGEISPTNNISTLAAISADIATLAGTTGLTTLANNAADISTVAGIVGDVTAVANIDAAVTAVNNNSANINAVNSNSTNINTVATDLSGSNNIGTVATDLAGSDTIGTVATNLAQVQNFANVYRISASAPTTSLDIGDLWYDTTNSVMKVYSSGGWITAASAVNGTAQRYKYTATAAQTTFSGLDDNSNNLAYDAGFADIYLNGIKLVSGSDYTATDGTSVVLTTGAALNDILEIIAYGTFELSNFSINDANDVSTSGVTDGQVLVYNASASAFQPGNASSAEVYGFNKDASGNLIVTTTNEGADNIDAATYAAFDDVLFSASGFTFSIDSNGNLIATI
jgi:tetrahydromethanopterin S-methyltransferase subunit B